MKISQNSLTLGYFSLLIKTILFLSITSLSLANENKIGSVTELNGTIVAITDELDERDLLVHDPIFLNEEIFVSEGSSATIQFNDSTAIIMRELTSININEFENSKKNPKFKTELLKGKIVIESGSIAKNNNGEMIVNITTSSLGLRGTRIDVDLKPNGKSNISLATDSFGNVGAIEVTSEGQTSIVTSTEQVLEISENYETLSRDKTDNEKEEAKTVSETLIKSSKIDEEEITKQLQKKLADGKLQDTNNDGVVDENDVQATKEQITTEKKQKIDFIVKNSKDENTEFLSDVINKSDEKNTGEVIEKIIEDNDNLVEGVVENLSDKDNKFLTTSTSVGADFIKEKIFETIVAKETDKSAAILSKVMAKADETTVASVINNISEKNMNEDSKLSLKVMADFSEKNPEKLEILAQNNADQIQKLTISAVEEAASSKEDADLLAKVVASASDDLVNKVVEEVSKNSTEENQTLSAHVLKAIVDSDSGKIDIINNDLKDIMIKQTIQSAQNQAEGTGVQQTQDMTSIVSDIIVNTNTETGSKMIEELNNSSNVMKNDLSLKIISGISVKNATKLNILSENNKEQIEQLTERAIENANASEESADLIAKVVATASDEITNKVIAEVTKNSIDENQALSAKVMKSIVEKTPDKIKNLNDENKETLFTQTVEAARNQNEDKENKSNDLSDVVADIIINADIETSAEIIEKLTNINTEEKSDLNLSVLENLSKKDFYEEKLEIISVTSNFNKESVDRFISKSLNDLTTDDKLDRVVKLVDKSKGIVADKIIETGKNDKESMNKVVKIITAIIEKDPKKATEILEKNKKTKTLIKNIKNKIDKGEAITGDDFEDVFNENISPN